MNIAGNDGIITHRVVRGTRNYGQRVDALVITLTGPQGCGKSLVAMRLKDLIRTLPVGAVVIKEVQ